MSNRRAIVVFVVCAVALVACGGDDKDDIFADPVSSSPVSSSVAQEEAGVAASEQVDDAGVETDAADAPTMDLNSELSGETVEYQDYERYYYADATNTDLTQDQVESIFVAYDDFLVGADTVWLVGEAGEPEFVADGLVDLQLEQYEKTADADFGAPADVYSYSNIEKITGSVDAGVVVEDCMEASVASPLYVVTSDFVRQDVTLELVDDIWQVTGVDILHDGQFASSDEPGCVPAIYAEQAELVTGEFLRLEAELLVQADADPTAMQDVTTPEFFATVTSKAERSDVGSVLVGTAEVVVDTLGYSTLAGPRTLYVGVCRQADAADGVTVLYGEYQVTRGLANGFPDMGDGLDVYAVSDRSPVEQMDDCPMGSGS